MKTQVLLADDHAIIRQGLIKILDDTDDFEVKAEAGHGHAVLDALRASDFDVLVLDISMPGRHGLELLKQVRELKPRMPILIFSMHPEEQFAVRALRAGANGYLSKEGDSDLILPALRKVAAGGMFISARVAELLATDAMPHHEALPHTTLSDREFDVLMRILSGASLTEIAQALNLSIKTVSTHKSHVFAKLGITNQLDLIRYAMSHGLGNDLPG